MKIKDLFINQSIIQSMLLKVTLSIFTFLILFMFFYGDVYWEKQQLKLSYNLLSIASKAQMEIESQMSSLEKLKKSNDINNEEKIKKKINDIVGTIIGTEYNCKIEFYDASWELLSQNKQQLEFGERSINDISVNLPLYNNGEIVGFITFYTKDTNYIFDSFYSFGRISIIILGLCIIFILMIRKKFNQIGYYLNEFCKLVTETNYYGEQERILLRLPELKPIFLKILFFTDTLKQVNADLKSSEIKITQIIDGISDGFCALDRNWRFTFVNSKLKRVTKEEFMDLIGKSIWEVFPHLVGSTTYEKMQEAMAQNHSVHWEEGGFAIPDQEHEFHAYPYMEGLTVFFRDISELKRHQEELGRLERLNLIGQLSAGISHEIRNPLTTVKGFLQIFGTKAKYSEDKEVLELMISEIDRANAIIFDFLSLSKVNSDNIKLQNINQTIRNLFPMLQADAFTNNKQVVLELDDILPDIRFNENEIKQLILNLVRNGLEVTPQEGRVYIKTFVKEDNVVLAICDQGPGIPQEIQEKIGTPFFTTKETGTGLGLAISIGIAQRHNAVFKFETGKNGTIFTITFPALKMN
ncbi:MAG: ATP-binding protein [Bacillota bacterium]|nr:ATP-binding protein [Bacillota bacterium]